MRILSIVSALALIAAAPVFAQAAAPNAAPSGTSTRNFDNERASGTTTITRDRDAGTFSRDTSVTRKSDGATMTRSTDRARTDTGFTESGTITRRDGSTYNLNGSLVRGEGSATRDRVVTDANGATVASRNVQASRANGQVTRNVTATGPQRLLRAGGPRGAGPRGAARGRRG